MKGGGSFPVFRKMPLPALYIDDSSVEIVASVRECKDIYRQYLISRYADDYDGRTAEEQKKYVEEMVKAHTTPKLFLYSGDNQWKCIAFALRNRNLIIVRGAEWLDKITWEDQIH